MTATRAPFTVRRVEVIPSERSTQVRTGSHTAAPHRFRALAETANPAFAVAVDLRLADGGVPVVEQLAVVPQPGTPLTSTTLRGLLLDPVVRAALRAAEKPITEEPGAAAGAFTVPGVPPEGQAWVSVPPGADQRVQLAARLYCEALASGSRAPAVATAKGMSISREHAARFIRRARAAGLIPPVGQVTRQQVPPAPGDAAQPQPWSPLTRMHG